MDVLKDMHCHITDSRGGLIYSDIPAACLNCVDACSSQSEVVVDCGMVGRRRRGVIVTSDGTVFLCTSDKEAVKSSKLFKREQAQLATLCKRLAILKEEVARQEALKARRLLHNLTTLNAHAIQDLYSVIPQDQLAEFAKSAFRTQRDFIKARLIDQPDAAASLFIGVLKNQAAVRSELAVFKRLYDSVDSVSRSSHALHKVVLNVANYFFQDFADRGVRVKIGESKERVSVNYETVQVALYHIFDNAAKYCKAGTVLKVDFAHGESSVCVLFDMVSFFVHEHERRNIYDDDYSGVVPRSTDKAGQGMGMGTIRQLLKLNNAELDAQWGAPLPASDGEPLYAHNTIIVRFR